MKSVHCTLRIGPCLAGSIDVFCSMGAGPWKGVSVEGQPRRGERVRQISKIDVNVHQIGHRLDPAVWR